MRKTNTEPTEEVPPENPREEGLPLRGAIEGSAQAGSEEEAKIVEKLPGDDILPPIFEQASASEEEAPAIAEEPQAIPGPEPGTSAEETAVILAGATDGEVIYDSGLAFVQGIKKRVSDKQPLDLQTAVLLIDRMTESTGRIDDLMRLTMRIIEEEDYNISHQVNVMIYAIKLGIGLSYPRPRLIELGLSALMHDVGMFRIPENIALKTGKLSEREIDVIKTHAEIGRDIMKPLSRSYPSLAAVAYEHHEREGGQGYPQGLKGNEIHEFARIIGLADSYEAMTHNRPYRKALMQSFSAKELIKSKSALFSQVVIKVFLKEISLYPLGSFVILNNKSIGEVVATDYNHPLRPTVKMLYDGEGNRVQDEVMIKLNENPLFFIVDGVSPEEVSAHR